MSIERARAALRGEKTDCIPILSTPTHAGWLKKHTGIDPRTDVVGAVIQGIKQLDSDLLIGGIPSRAPAQTDDPNLYGLYTTDWRQKGRGPKDWRRPF